MSDEEGRLTNERNRGARAQALLDNDLFKDAVASIEHRLIDEWRKSPLRDTDGREKLHMMQHLLDKLVCHIRDHIQTGQLASHSLVDLEKRRKLFGKSW